MALFDAFMVPTFKVWNAAGSLYRYTEPSRITRKSPIKDFLEEASTLPKNMQETRNPEEAFAPRGS